jgi:hypothetical protein
MFLKAACKHRNQTPFEILQSACKHRNQTPFEILQSAKLRHLENGFHNTSLERRLSKAIVGVERKRMDCIRKR